MFSSEDGPYDAICCESCLARSYASLILIVLLAAPPAMAQATSTFNGRVLDQGDAVLPGVTVTAVTRARVSRARP